MTMIGKSVRLQRNTVRRRTKGNGTDGILIGTGRLLWMVHCFWLGNYLTKLIEKVRI